MNLYPLVRPFVFLLDPEMAHGLSVWALKAGLVPVAPAPSDPCLAVNLWGMSFPGPVGLAAGFDKNAEVVDPLFDQGFGFVEVGTVTPQPQPGNPQPRLFRLVRDEAVVNRMGFNNDGLAAVLVRLIERRAKPGIVGVNLGKNKDQTDAIADYVKGVEFFAPIAGYLVVNVSSPNTPGLRALQGRESLQKLLDAVLQARSGAPRQPPLLLKIAPDLTEPDKADIAAVALSSGIDGLVVSNTTVARPDGLHAKQGAETGGLSGRPLFEPSTRLLADLYRLTEGRLPLIGVGGVDSAETAYAKIKNGASLVQVYSGMVFKGPDLAAQIHAGLPALLERDGFAHLSDAVGSDVR
ncbi:MAG: quinone-dependent dihydroorotate dehydrogenase [Rhodospirillales bacterium]